MLIARLVLSSSGTGAQGNEPMGSGFPTSTGVPGPPVQGNGPSTGLNLGLPIAVIVGVVCGIVGFFIIIGCITYYRKRRAMARREGEVDVPSVVRDKQDGTDEGRAKSQ